MARKVDNDAPRMLIIEFKTESGEVWGSLKAEAREFKTGSLGFYANGKIKNPKNALPYQVGTNIILVGSKEEAP
ncbi:MAG TPA: hypothetical protein V6D17_09800 [Candidatus Obscuribacterales bacterium]